MPRRVSSLWQDLIRRLAALSVAAGLLVAAGPAPAPQGTQAPAPPSGTSPSNPGGDQPPLGAGVPQAAPTGTPDQVVASVEGHPIYLRELGKAEQTLPANMRNMPLASLYPVLLDLMVDHQALVMLALRRGLENDPAVKRQIQEATDRALEGVLLGLDAAPKVTEDAIRARYNQEYGNQPEIAQVRARHILVGSEAEATRLIAELKKGANFAALAKQYSKDPDGQKGGDLGFFSRAQVLPGFADVAFSLQPGQVADKPVHNEFGWHVLQVEERRTIPAPSYAEMHDALQKQLMQEAVRQEVALARSQLTIHEWNLDGSPIDTVVRPANAAVPPK
jgi:peptidyl-prolyl cis-trans isomerase C